MREQDADPMEEIVLATGEETMFVTGTLRTGEQATLCLTRGRGKTAWKQRAISDSAKHLNRDYVCGEEFEDIEALWFRCDWRRYTLSASLNADESDGTDCNWGGS